MLKKLGFSISISVICTILLMFLGVIAPSHVLVTSVFMSLACLFYGVAINKVNTLGEV